MSTKTPSTKVGEHYDNIYASDKGAFSPKTRNTLLAALSEYIKPGSLLDIGCGAGRFAIPLSLKGFEVTGIDLSPEGINRAKENAEKSGSKAKFLIGDFLSMELGGNFDIVMMNFVMHHFAESDKRKAVQKMMGLAKQNGLNIIAFRTDLSWGKQTFEKELKRFYEGSKWEIVKYSDEIVTSDLNQNPLHFRYLIARKPSQ